ncbi:MAG TPA: hypothetical protein VK508_01720 [Cyclobacteriaceae bacterium]|nr:hypothetical protein [Cyclobacteriaceae bacterium]
MKNILLILFFLASITILAQPVTLEKGSTLEIKQSDSGQITYTVIQAPVVKTPIGPVFTDAKPLFAKDVKIPGYIFPVDLGGKQDITLNEAWPTGIALNGLTGAVRITNEGTVIVGSSTPAYTFSTTHGIQSLGATNDVTIAGKSFAEPIIIKAGANQSGIGWNATGTGSRLNVSNVIFDNVGYADILASSGSGKEYGEINLSFLRSKGSKTKTGEFIYIGNNVTSIPTRKATIQHVAAMDIAREFVQVKWADNFSISNFTGVNIGFANGAGQNHAIQIEASTGTVKDFVIQNVPRGMNIFSHGDSIRNGAIAFTIDGGYVGDAKEAFPNDPHLNGKPIVIDGIDFMKLNPGNAKYILAVRESTADVYVINCKFPPGTESVFLDQRIKGYTNKLIGGLNDHGNSVSTTPVPTFISTDVNSVDFLKLSEPYHIKKGRGSLTPKP